MNRSHWSNLLPLSIGSHAGFHTHLSLQRDQDPGRVELERFIHQRFASVHQADVQEFLPELLALHDSQGQLIAAAGLRAASSGPLFLEHYLDEPLDVAVSRLAGTALTRDCMVEVGNLASLSAGSARTLIIAVTWLLAARGLRWVAFTGAATLINSFSRLGLVPTPLASANADRLGTRMDAWGTYYAQHPQVFAGNISHGFEALSQSGVFQRLGLPASLQETGHAA